ncbi:MAG: penicillin-binding protein 1C [Verrucomicrobia subdivision 3 bacterium]|nr:penicillin-binding protein 1C [Limisphaerales bacterium]
MSDRLRQLREWFARKVWRRWALRFGCVWLVGWMGLQAVVTLMPLPTAMGVPPVFSPQATDRNGEPLRLLLTSDERFFQPVALEDCAPVFLQATLAAEDKRFWRHAGVDWFGTVRAVKEIAVHRRVMSGASTITQQLIKNAEPRPRTVRTKIFENLQALKLERSWSKSEILTAYLNRIDYGNLCRGAGTAAWFYFGKPLADVSPAEAAFLAALPNGPTRLNPHRHFNRAKRRQLIILGRMRRLGWLDVAAHHRACAEPIALNRDGRAFAAAHFVDWVSQQREVKANVQTTLDLPLNQFVHRTLVERLNRLAQRDVSNGAVVVIENATGNVLAWVGSRDYFEAESGQVNGAWARRSAGSTFKPFTYLLALESGMSPATVIADVRTDFATSTGVFSPQNFNRQFHGPMRLRVALANSLNVSAVKVLEAAGGAEALHQRLRECGLSTLEAEANHYGLGLTIGNAEARLLELTNAYATLARLGIHRSLRVLANDPQSSQRIFDSRHTWLITDMLSDNAARARAFGWESALAFEFPVACKTGTSSDFRDNWAMGYTPEFTVGVWVGNFDGAPMRNVSGVTGAAPVMHAVMEHLRERFGTSDFARPNGLVRAQVNPITGRRAGQGVGEWFVVGNLPHCETPNDFDAEGRVKLGADYVEWFASTDNTLHNRVALDVSQIAELRVLAPLAGTVFYLDPDLPPSSRQVRLRVNAASAQWSSKTLECVARDGDVFARLQPGRHRLTADVDGRRLETWIEVEEL